MFSPTSVFSFLQMILFSSLFEKTIGLMCYVTDPETGITAVVVKENFKFCEIYPSLPNSKQPNLMTSSADGLTLTDLDKPFIKMFEENDRTYNMISVCLYEKYDWTKAFNPKFHSLKEAMNIEYTLRCLCNYDLCNSPATFSSYINNLSN